MIRKDQSESKSPGGILIPEDSRGKPHSGTVIAVGPGRIENGVLVGMNVTVGDTVLFDHWKGTELKISGEILLIVTEDDIVGIVD